jgi:hypothetical protein
LRRDFHQIKACFLSQIISLAGTDDPQLFTLSTNQPDFRRVDFFIEAMRLIQSDGKNSRKLTKRTKTKP